MTAPMRVPSGGQLGYEYDIEFGHIRHASAHLDAGRALRRHGAVILDARRVHALDATGRPAEQRGAWFRVRAVMPHAVLVSMLARDGWRV